MSQKSNKSQSDVIPDRLKIRKEAENNYKKIRKVNDSAFERENEGRLIERLRQRENFIPELSLVAELDDEIVGHILFYPITILSDTSKFLSLSLGPMAVRKLGTVPNY